MLSTESPHTLRTNVTSLSLSSVYFCQIPPAAVLQHPALPFNSQPCLPTGSQPPPYYNSAVCPKPHVPGCPLPCPSAQGHLRLHFSLEASWTPYPTLSSGYKGSMGLFLFLVGVLIAVMALSSGIRNLKEISAKLLYPLQELFPQNHYQVW